MDYIEISEGISLAIDKIEAISVNADGLTCTVRTEWNTYQSTFPYRVLLELLNRREAQPERKEELNILKTLGSFAG